MLLVGPVCSSRKSLISFAQALAAAVKDIPDLVVQLCDCRVSCVFGLDLCSFAPKV